MGYYSSYCDFKLYLNYSLYFMVVYNNYKLKKKKQLIYDLNLCKYYLLLY